MRVTPHHLARRASRELPRLAGWVDAATPEADGWRLDGWAMLPWRGPCDTIRVRFDGADRGVATPTDRPDLFEQVYWVRGVRRAGFSVTLPEGSDAGRLELIGERGGKALGRLATTFISPEREVAPLPPATLAERVSDVSGDAFRLSGLQASTDLIDSIERHRDGARAARVLDWGCGCGRVARHVVRHSGELLGCDLDEEAVAWCSKNLDGRFSISTSEPPLPYADAAVDVVYASSVFTHLARSEQRRWLGELRRVLAPDGLLVASVAGPYAWLLGRPNRLRGRSAPGSLLHRAVALRRAAHLSRAGVIDAIPDAHLDGIAPPGYYRSTFQTRAYTVEAWSDDFEVVEYLNRGLNGHQDLVVLRRR